jgi:hypothetical protein
MGGPGTQPDPNKKRRKQFVNKELNRQLLLAQLAGMRGGTILSSPQPAAATTGTTLLRTDRTGSGR